MDARTLDEIKAAMKTLGVTAEALANQIGVSTSKLNKELAPGTTTSDEVIFRRIARVLSLDLDIFAENARTSHGGYSKKWAIDELCGDYHVIWPGIENPESFSLYGMTLRWSQENRSIIWNETGRDYHRNHRGELIQYSPNPIYYFFSHSQRGHGMRIIHTSRQIGSGNFFGFITTNTDKFGPPVPIVSPICILKAHEARSPGTILPGHNFYDWCKDNLIKAQASKLFHSNFPSRSA